MGKKLRHMGLTLGKEEHARFHKDSPNLTLAEQRALGAGSRAVDPLIVGRGLMRWCVKQGWLRQRGKEYFATPEGVGEMRACFGIQL